MGVTIEKLRETLNNKYTTMPNIVRVSLEFIEQEVYFNELVNRLVRLGQEGTFGHQVLVENFIDYYQEYFIGTLSCPDKYSTERVLVMLYNLSNVSRTAAINLQEGIMLNEPNKNPTNKPDLKVETKVKSNRSEEHMRKMREAKERKRLERLKNENKKTNK